MRGYNITRAAIKIATRTSTYLNLSCTSSVVTKCVSFPTPRLYQHMYREYCMNSSDTDSDSMELSNVVKKLNKIAHPSLAGSWDNVGLLVEPSAPHTVSSILLTNDLTPPVLDEAISKQVNMIISYHPPIFSPMKKLLQRQWKEKIVVRCIENGIAVFSPHTTHDCLQGGVNDWLISSFDCSSIQPVEQHLEMANSFTHTAKFSVSSSKSEQLSVALKAEQNIDVKECSSSDDSVSYNVQCNMSGLTNLMKILQDIGMPSSMEVSELAKTPKVGYGMGRKGKLTTPISIEEAVSKVKQHLKLDHVRLAKAPGVNKISSVAVCAGSGSGVLRNIPVDLYVTGELSHHDVLHAVCSGTCVILCDHSNTERGYLTELRSMLQKNLNKETQIFISEVDADPLKVV